MKISAKLLILAMALFLVSASVVFFFKAMTTPPAHMEDVDEFSVAIKKDIDNIETVSTQEEFDSIHIWILQELKNWKWNDYINDTQYDEHILAFYQKYVPMFVDAIKERFSHDIWGEKENAYIAKQVVSIQSEKFVKQNRTVIDSDIDLKAKLAELTDIGSNYDDAKKLVSSTKYKNIVDASSRINKAMDFCSDIYIRHSDLNSKLMSFPDDIGNSHFNLLNAYYAKIANWSYYSLNQTKENYSNFEQLVKDYTYADIYGDEHPKSTSDLVDQAKQYMQDAYDNKCVLTLNGSSGSYTTPLWSNSSGVYTYNIYTDHPDGYSVTDLSDWIKVTNKSNNSLSISYDKNDLANPRNGYFYVKAGNKSVKVNCKQSSLEQSVNITSVNQNHNIWSNGKKGMNITVYFTAKGYSNKTLYINLYFYDSNGNALKDFNKSYYTTDGCVATSTTYTPSLSEISTSVTLFMPYDELHMSRGNHSLKFYSSILCESKNLTSSSYYYFDFNNN